MRVEIAKKVEAADSLQTLFNLIWYEYDNLDANAVVKCYLKLPPLLKQEAEITRRPETLLERPNSLLGLLIDKTLFHFSVLTHFQLVQICNALLNCKIQSERLHRAIVNCFATHPIQYGAYPFIIPVLINCLSKLRFKDSNWQKAILNLASAFFENQKEIARNPTDSAHFTKRITRLRFFGFVANALLNISIDHQVKQDVLHYILYGVRDLGLIEAPYEKCMGETITMAKASMAIDIDDRSIHEELLQGIIGAVQSGLISLTAEGAACLLQYYDFLKHIDIWDKSHDAINHNLQRYFSQHNFVSGPFADTSSSFTPYEALRRQVLASTFNPNAGEFIVEKDVNNCSRLI